MGLNIIGEEFESELDYYLNGTLIVYVEDLGLKRKGELDSLIENKYEGLIDIVLEMSKYNKKVYEFAISGYGKCEGKTVLMLKPIYLQDMELFKYYYLPGETEPEYSEGVVSYGRYYSYQPSAYQTEEDELVDWVGDVRKARDGEYIFNENGINYLVDLDLEYEEEIESLGKLDELGVLYKMEQDNFMGTYIVHYVMNTGERVQDEFHVDKIEDGQVYFKFDNNTGRNFMTVPTNIKFYDDNGNPHYWNVRIHNGVEYIPYSPEESL